MAHLMAFDRNYVDTPTPFVKSNSVSKVFVDRYSCHRKSVGLCNTCGTLAYLPTIKNGKMSMSCQVCTDKLYKIRR